MADKGDVYYCTWRKNEAGELIGWEKRNRSLSASADTPLELQDALVQIVGEHYNDQEAALHFDPPLFLTNEWDHLFVDGLYQLGWNSTFTYPDSAATAFVGGRCPQCGGGLGSRGAERLRVKNISAETGGAFSATGSAPPPQGLPGWLMIISEAFLRTLSDDERATFEARAVQFTGEAPRVFFEVIPKTFMPRVSIKDVPVGGWRCETCPQRVFTNGGSIGSQVTLVCRSDLPSTTPPLLFVGKPRSFEVYTTKARWESLCGKSFARKLDGGPLGVVEEDVCERTPQLPTLSERLAAAATRVRNNPFRRPNR